MKLNPNTANWMDWSEAHETRFGEDVAAIYLLNPGMDPPKRRSKHELVLSFWDRTELSGLDAAVAGLLGGRPALCVRARAFMLGDNGGWPWRPPLSDDARRIAAFVDSLPHEVTTFVVACEFGRSRSRAVAEWIASRRGIEAKGNHFRGVANPLLRRLLSRVR